MKNSKLKTSDFIDRYASLLVDIQRTLSQKSLLHCDGFNSIGEILVSPNYKIGKTLKEEKKYEKEN